MNLDEAIIHAREEAKRNRELGNLECADEHERLSMWLNEYRDMKGKEKPITGNVAMILELIRERDCKTFCERNAMTIAIEAVQRCGLSNVCGPGWVY